jgi:hypothetical protein
MKQTLKRGAAEVANTAKARPKEVRWSLGGAVLGIVAGLLIGGVGVAAMGDAVGVPAAVILALVGAMTGNRVGVEFDRRDSARL